MTTNDDVELIRVGLYWDAVMAPADIGERALKVLADATGAVIADYSLMYWLIGPGSAQYWRALRRVQALGAHRADVPYMGVPPATHATGPRLHWRFPVGPGRYLTDANRLHEALAQAVVDQISSTEEATAR
ncbi:hypothetical protein [Streptomyces sp. NBRC 110028]|uniref:hypothetical protein n=1 Tax=Streptomyces sp. NBRC 110028 TaxID=1621260 RepID=UPI000B243F37|nr:hypothetical protein [Streptomyces sp. NBRC 110028]